ncbi:hypothetical protein Pfo_021302 [Paulownia fortunei]|nr:hypothetical protein Pfo_021302 [Paulownia fortunei]
MINVQLLMESNLRHLELRVQSGTICLQCGNRGFTNAFVYCVKCLDVAVHRYCLDVIPETFDEFVHWACDDCEAEVQNQSAVSDHDAIPSQTRDCIVSKNIKRLSGVGTKKKNLVVVQTLEHVYKDGPEQSYDACTELDFVECGESARECNLMQLGGKNDENAILLPADERNRCQQSSSQQLEEEKAKGNLMQHARLSDGTLKENKKKKRSITESTMVKDQDRLGNTSSKQSHEERVKVDISECARLASDSTLPSKVKENKGSEQKGQECISWKPLDSDTDPCTAEHPVVICNGPLKSSKKKKTVMSSEAILQEQMHGTGSGQPLQEGKGFNLENQCADTSNEQSKFGPSKDHINNRESEDGEERSSARRRRNNFCNDLPKDLDISSAEPVVMPIWRGSFNIWNKKHEILDGLIAHMSSKACQKVYEEACQFQPVLQLEMLPRSVVWPKSFETSEPSGDNIALYFFPSEISERVFDHLVEEMMRKELALKAIVQNAELLIFTSTELPLLYWRFQGKYYLWGVFRGKQSSPSHSHSCRGELGDNPIIHADLPNDAGSSGGKISVTMKGCGDRSPRSPLSNCSSYGSGNF